MKKGGGREEKENIEGRQSDRETDWRKTSPLLNRMTMCTRSPIWQSCNLAIRQTDQQHHQQQQRQQERQWIESRPSIPGVRAVTVARIRALSRV